MMSERIYELLGFDAEVVGHVEIEGFACRIVTHHDDGDDTFLEFPRDLCDEVADALRLAGQG
jgi:hypothetical protein